MKEKEKDLEIQKLESKVVALRSEIKFKGSMIDEMQNDLNISNEDWNRESQEYKSKIRELNILLDEQSKSGNYDGKVNIIQETINLIMHKFEEIKKLLSGYISKQRDLDQKMEYLDASNDKLAKVNTEKEIQICELTKKFEEDITSRVH